LHWGLWNLKDYWRLNVLLQDLLSPFILMTYEDVTPESKGSIYLFLEEVCYYEERDIGSKVH